MSEEIEEKYLLPAEVELYLRDNTNRISGYMYNDDKGRSITKNSFIAGFSKGKIHACNKILEYIKENKLPKEDFLPLIEFILEKKLKNQQCQQINK